jgi:ATP-dependent Clp protease ATP-binding subunit ClpB
MNLNKFTEKASEAVLGAQKLAETDGHPQIEPEHLLITLAEQQDGVVPALLRKLQIDPATIARRHARRSASSRRCTADRPRRFRRG